MRKLLFLAAAALLAATPAAGAALSDAIHADMPRLMALYRDLHAHPELSMQEVRTPALHACGHDTHITTWLATATRLAAMKDQWSGTLVMILQPGEEVGMGAKAMLEDGLFTRFPKPDTMLAFHDSASLPAGVIGVTKG